MKTKTANKPRHITGDNVARGFQASKIAGSVL
jgi:hypothetical protein